MRVVENIVRELAFNIEHGSWRTINQLSSDPQATAAAKIVTIDLINQLRQVIQSAMERSVDEDQLARLRLYSHIVDKAQQANTR